MIRNPQQLHLMRLGLPAVPANGGGGHSSSSTSTSSQSTDQRLAVTSGVGATASSGGSVVLNVNQLDDGAIAGAFGLGAQALQGIESFGTASMSASSATAQAAMAGMLHNSDTVQKAYADAATEAIDTSKAAYTNATSMIASAYQDASSQVSAAYQDTKTSNVRTLMIGALIVAAIAVSAPLIAKEV
ncbi:hypothetical protein [Trinickia symbiotica]|uniref:Uncharacterized protein n=1 Tax=Trinickia symbiotica TaxID=863227 RepID=A0A2N7X9Q2_9BURK|nr:hypothetical protein [Trinickia symbiotica]PMS38458.1 hypothetical protein C0Z20_00805 [Trinickia symbiotica]